jgi:hypothetical protein
MLQAGRRLLSRPSPSRGALLGWLLLPLLALSLLETQQPHYALPAVPAAALLLSGTLEGRRRWVSLALGAAALASAALLLAAGFAPGLVSGLLLEPGPASALASNLALRATALIAALVLAGCALWRGAPRVAAPWRRAVVATAAAFLAGVLALPALDRLLVPRALLARAEVARAARLEAPSSLRSAIRVLAEREDVDLLAEEWIAGELQREPGLVALVWEQDLPRLGLAPGATQEIGRGFAKGRVLVALRGSKGTDGAGPEVSLPPASP